MEKKYLLLNVSVVYISHAVIALDSSCLVKEKASGEMKPCQFPVRFSKKEKGFEKIYYACTDFLDPNQKFWCSTQVNVDTRDHIKNAE